jgi:hypothetical protein
LSIPSFMTPAAMRGPMFLFLPRPETEKARTIRIEENKIEYNKMEYNKID